MAYPVISAPYGLKPVNSIGNSNYSGTTREYAIPNGYATNIFYGDLVGLSRGYLQRLSVTAGAAGTVAGVFLGCYYTNPSTKQPTYAQYWPSGTAAGDAVAVVGDDPDLLFKAVVCSAGVTIASGNSALIGQNLSMINNSGNVNTGNSANAVLAPAATPAVTATLPLRCLGLVKETAVSLDTATYASIATATVTSTAIPKALPVGTEVLSISPTGQLVPSGSFVATAAAAGATTVVLNQAPLVAFGASATLVFIQYPEILVKLNFGQNQLQSGLAIA
jgi:hypothetical protein